MANGGRSIERDVLTGLKWWWLSRLQVSVSYSFFKFVQMATFRWLGDGVWVIGDLLDLVAMAGGRRWSGARAREKCCASGKFVLLLPGKNKAYSRMFTRSCTREGKDDVSGLFSCVPSF